MFSRNYIFIIGSVTVVAVGQIMFKIAAQHLRILPSHSPLSFLRDNIGPLCILAAALLLYAMSTIAWICAIRTTPLSVAYMFYSLAFVIVPTLAFLLFGEPVPRYFLPGLVLIIAGIVLVASG